MNPDQQDHSASGSDPSDSPPQVWSFWKTIGFALVIFLSALIGQVLVAVAYIVRARSGNSHLDLKAYMESLNSNGLFISICLLVSGVIICGCTWFFAGLRKGFSPKDYFQKGLSAREYLSLEPFRSATFLKWLIVYIVLLAISESLTAYLKIDIVPQYMIDAFFSARYNPLLWISVVIVAPLAEELLVRGFLFRGILHSMGAFAAILITSIGWACIHLQYDIFGMSHLFVFGVMLGLARLKTGSILPGFYIHALNNFISTLQVILDAR